MYENSNKKVMCLKFENPWCAAVVPTDTSEDYIKWSLFHFLRLIIEEYICWNWTQKIN